MKLHETTVQKLLKVYEVNSGWTEEKKLLNALRMLDLSVYTQQNGVKILVPTEELNRHLAMANNQEQSARQERMAKLVEEAKKANGEI
tara:strand:+ start:454 stop:717 length:264 start_codon:yes stop_codon:yes gene_type:complete